MKEIPPLKVVQAASPTTRGIGAYLSRAWADRGSLNSLERGGFACFFYLTLTTHLEASLAEVVDRRLMYTRSAMRVLAIQPVNVNGEASTKGHDAKLIHQTLSSMVTNYAKRAERAALESMVELYSDVFSVQLSSILGEDYPDLVALGRLRNVLAHGRTMVLRFDDDEKNLSDLSKSPLEAAAKQLRSAGLIETLKFEGTKLGAFFEALYSDRALLYFLRKAKSIESKIKTSPTFEPEGEYPLFVELPDLS